MGAMGCYGNNHTLSLGSYHLIPFFFFLNAEQSQYNTRQEGKVIIKKDIGCIGNLRAF
jgi:hypothetical protein